MPFRSNRLLLSAVAVLALLPAAAPFASEISVQAGLIVCNNPAFDTLVMLEFPFTVNRNQFDSYRPDSTNPDWYSRIFAQVTLMDSRGMQVDSTSTYFSVRSETRETAAEGVKLFNQLVLLVPPGLYSARLTVIDAVDKDEGTVFFDKIVAEPAPTARLALGAARLAYRIRVVDTAGTSYNRRMVRNGFEVLTNPVGLVDESDTVVYVYAEVYNLVADDAENRYRLGFRVLDAEGDEVRNFGQAFRPKPGRAAVIAQKLPYGSLAAGLYQLQIDVYDPVSAQSDTADLYFHIMSPGDVARLTSLSADAQVTSPYDSLPLEEQLQVVRHRLTPDDEATLANLTEEGTKNFLESYWRQNDEYPLTTVNETRDRLVALYRYANEKYSTSQDRQDGWQTDRGRIVMVFGLPDKIDEQDAPIVGHGFEIWYYDRIQEGLVFVFEVQEGFSDYYIVHSNADGERYDEAWAERLKSQGFKELMQDM